MVIRYRISVTTFWFVSFPLLKKYYFCKKIKPMKFVWPFLVIVLFSGLRVVAQDSIPVEIDTMVYTVADKMPEFEGGDSMLVKYIKENVHYPSNITSPGVKEGTVYINFIVEKDGSVSNIHVLKGICDELNTEAFRAVKEMPAWNPGIKNGKIVRVSMTLPFVFDFLEMAPRVNVEDMSPENMPQFPGGLSALGKYISSNMHYPKDAAQKGYHGRVFVAFVIDTDGSIIEARVLQGVCESIDQEALRIVNAMPKWIPGTDQGQPVQVRYILPLNFKLF